MTDPSAAPAPARARKRPAKLKPGAAGAGKSKPSSRVEAARAATAPEPPPSPAPQPQAEARGAARMEFLSPTQRDSLEKLSLNLTRAAMTAQGAIAEAALRQADRPSALTPDPFHVAPALTDVMGRLAAQPDRMMRAQADLFSRYMDLWKSTTRRMAGETPEAVVAPGKGDKRFADPDW